MTIKKAFAPYKQGMPAVHLYEKLSGISLETPDSGLNTFYSVTNSYLASGNHRSRILSTSDSISGVTYLHTFLYA